MILGYARKFLEVNLSTERIKQTHFQDEVLREYVGGRGLATKILWDRLGNKWETIDPLEPENILKKRKRCQLISIILKIRDYKICHRKR